MKVANLSALRTGRLYPQDILIFFSAGNRVVPTTVMRPEGLKDEKLINLLAPKFYI